MKSNNYYSIKLSKEYLNYFRCLINKQPLSAEILMFFIEKIGKTKNAIVCSYKLLQEITGYSRASVVRAVRILKKDNWIDTVKIGNATAYCVNEQVDWKINKEGLQYAIFSSIVVATAAEQDNNFLEKSNKKLIHIPFIENK